MVVRRLEEEGHREAAADEILPVRAERAGPAFSLCPLNPASWDFPLDPAVWVF